MEKLNLQLERSVYVLEGVIANKQSEIKNLTNELEKERRLKRTAEEKLSTMTESIIQLYSEMDVIIKKIKSESQACNEESDSPINYLNQLSSEVDKRFDQVFENNCKIQEELASMNNTLEKLEQYLAEGPCENEYDSDDQYPDKTKTMIYKDLAPENGDQQQETIVLLHAMDYSMINSKNSFNCVCGQIFSSKQNLIQHVKYYTVERKFPCEMCLERFRGTYHLKKHLQTVHNVTLDETSSSLMGCRECGKLFVTKKDLFYHQKVSHSINKRPKETSIGTKGSDGCHHEKDYSKKDLGFFCVCGAKYRHNSSLVQHILFLTSEWKFNCKTCGQKFFAATQLRKHMTQSHKFRPGRYRPSYGCRRCGKLFRTLGLLIKHRSLDHRNETRIMSPTKEKLVTGLRSPHPDFSAPPKLTPHFADELFSSQEVESHYDSHDFAVPDGPYADPRRFYCTCSRHFATRKQLSDHIRAKIKGKIFKCSLCSSAFEFHVNLKLHVRKTHKVQYQQGRFGCKDCGQTFQLYQELMTHRLSNHYSYTKR